MTAAPHLTPPIKLATLTEWESGDLPLCRIPVDGTQQAGGRTRPATHDPADQMIALDVICNPVVNFDPGESSEAAIDRFAQRLERLQRPVCGTDVSDALLVLGPARSRIGDADEAPGAADDVTAAALEQIRDGWPALVEVTSETGDSAGVVELTADRERVAIVGLIALGGDPSDRASADDRVAAFVRWLAHEHARHVPAYLLIAAATEAWQQPALTLAQRIHASIVIVPGGAVSRDVFKVSEARLRDVTSEIPAVTVISAPGFDVGAKPWPGYLRLRLRPASGELQVAAHRDDANDDRPFTREITTSVRSASRVMSGEWRLRQRVDALLGGVRDADALGIAVEQRWQRDGYVALSFPDEQDFPDLPINQRKQYRLLLLLRRRPGTNRYDILMSHHTPLRPPAVADWCSLLLPAFGSVARLLERLRDDVMRQAREEPQRAERASRAREFETAVNNILGHAARQGRDVWDDRLTQLARRTVRELSPTSGAVTEYDYRLVTPLPFVERARQPAPTDDPQTQDAIRDEARVLSWLAQLDAVSEPGDSSGAARFPFSCVATGGAGMRWEPETDLADLADADLVREQATKLPPGAVWFPLGDITSDDPADWPWTHSPAMVARNADVMRWLYAELRTCTVDGRLPAQLLLGGLDPAADVYRVVGAPLPFASDADRVPSPAADPDAQPIDADSTREALRHVRIGEEGKRRADGDDDAPIAGELAYPPDAVDIQRVVLLRAGEARPGTRILVYEARADDELNTTEWREREPMGVLRPVQRYVLADGIERARKVNALIDDGLRDDPWGFARIQRGNGQIVACTPPIIERSARESYELDDGRGLREFLICDGNHRVVSRVWRHGRPMAAVAVVGEVPHPYYARPFSQFEWDVTAGNELQAPPDTASKYVVRRPADGREVPPDWYRRFFRRLELGFGSLGGQGGRSI